MCQPGYRCRCSPFGVMYLYFKKDLWRAFLKVMELINWQEFMRNAKETRSLGDTNLSYPGIGPFA